MRHVMLCVVAASFACSCTTTSSAATPAGPSVKNDPNEVNPYGKVFEGDGITVEMAMLAQQNAAGVNDVLMRITGAEAFSDGINGKVLRYGARPAGAGGTGMDIFFPQKNGTDYVRMTLRNRSWEVYLNSKSIRLMANDEKAKQLDTKKLAAAVETAKEQS